MIIFKSAKALNSYLLRKKSVKKSIGFVPTMGALHAGHLSLIHSAKKNNDIIVSSLFINPTQFNNKSDFEKYPKTVEQDVNKLEQEGCDILFLPATSEIYPPGFNSARYDLGNLETILEGKFRPDHFQGVAQVVHRLLDIVPADDLFIGQKDFQQCMVIKKLVSITGKNTRVNIHPTIRETDGLAMSSRNLRLTEKQRGMSVKIFETLSGVNKQIKRGPLGVIKKEAVELLEQSGFKVDYVEIADADNLEPVDHWNGSDKLVILAAAYLGEIRLIDNLVR